MESVRSRAYQTMNVAASAIVKTTVVTTRLMPRLSVRLSVISVPKMLIRTTATQYRAGV